VENVVSLCTRHIVSIGCEPSLQTLENVYNMVGIDFVVRYEDSQL